MKKKKNSAARLYIFYIKDEGEGALEVAWRLAVWDVWLRSYMKGRNKFSLTSMSHLRTHLRRMCPFKVYVAKNQKNKS